MYCNKCGKEVDNNEKFCPYCGNKLTDDAVVSGETTTATSNASLVFAIIGLVLGISSIALCFVPIFGIMLGLAGIVLAILGLKSRKHGMAVTGLALSIVGAILSVILTISIMVLANKPKSTVAKLAEREAELVFNTAKTVILEMSEYDYGTQTKIDGVVKNGTIYSITAKDLKSEGHIYVNPFDSTEEDGGMTVSYDSVQKTFVVTIDGTIFNYKITYKKGTFTAKK